MLVKLPGQKFPGSRKQMHQTITQHIQQTGHQDAPLYLYLIVGTGFLPIRLSAYLDWPTRHAGKSRCQMVQENSISLKVASVYPYIWSGIGLLSGVPDFGPCLITDLFSITTQYSVSVSFILSCTLSNLHQSGHPSFPAQDVFSLSTFLLMS